MSTTGSYGGSDHLAPAINPMYHHHSDMNYVAEYDVVKADRMSPAMHYTPTNPHQGTMRMDQSSKHLINNQDDYDTDSSSSRSIIVVYAFALLLCLLAFINLILVCLVWEGLVKPTPADNIPASSLSPTSSTQSACNCRAVDMANTATQLLNNLSTTVAELQAQVENLTSRAKEQSNELQSRLDKHSSHIDVMKNNFATPQSLHVNLTISPFKDCKNGPFQKFQLPGLFTLYWTCTTKDPTETNAVNPLQLSNSSSNPPQLTIDNLRYFETQCLCAYFGSSSNLPACQQEVMRCPLIQPITEAMLHFS